MRVRCGACSKCLLSQAGKVTMIMLPSLVLGVLAGHHVRLVMSSGHTGVGHLVSAVI